MIALGDQSSSLARVNRDHEGNIPSVYPAFAENRMTQKVFSSDALPSSNRPVENPLSPGWRLPIFVQARFTVLQKTLVRIKLFIAAQENRWMY
jgi:hypothetical protein